MKRATSLLALALSLSLLAVAPLATPSRAQSLLALANPANKTSAEIVRKVNDGHGADRVRVVVQPKGSWSGDLDTALAGVGASDVRLFENFNFRVVSLPAGAAAALAQRTDVAYVSLNRELRTLGHVSLTSGADAVRATAGT